MLLYLRMHIRVHMIQINLRNIPKWDGNIKKEAEKELSGEVYTNLETLLHILIVSWIVSNEKLYYE